MGLFGWELKRKKIPSYTFTEEDRELSQAVRAERSRLKMKELLLEQRALDLELAQIERELQELPGEDDGLNPDKLLMMLLSGRLALPSLSGTSPPNLPNGTNAEEPTGKDLSDEEVHAMIAKFSKKEQKLAAKLPEEALLIHAARLFPGYSQKTYEKAIGILKGVS